MASYLYQPPPLSSLTSPLLYAHPHIQVGTIPIISQTVIGSIPIFPTIPSLENYLNPLHQQKREHATGLIQHSTNPARLHQVQALRSIQWSQTPSSATSRCCLRSIHESLQDTFCTHSKKEGDPCMLARNNIERISTDFEDFLPKDGPIRMHLPHLALPTHANCPISQLTCPIRPSILGPHPSTVTIPSLNLSSLSRKHLPSHHTLQTKPILKKATKMDQVDEELIRKFAQLHTASSSSATALVLSSSAVETRDWGLCMRAKVCKDKMVFEAQFEKLMRRAWGAKPATVFTQIERGSYLIEFTGKSEMLRILNEGPWIYRQDLVAVAPCTTEEQLTHPIDKVELWVQFHNVQDDSLTDEGILMLTSQVGTQVTEPVRGFINGRRFFKIKLAVLLDGPFKDFISVTHPTRGDIIVYLVYEKLGRLCDFCGMIGHDLNTCTERTQLVRIKNNPINQNRPDLKNILKPNFGPWRLCPELLPAFGPSPKSSPKPTSGQKRPLNDLSHSVTPRYTSSPSLPLTILIPSEDTSTTSAPPENDHLNTYTK